MDESRPLTITREDAPTRGRYVARMEGVDEPAELTFSKTSPTLVIADHTAVPDSMRGGGVGARLAERLVADARAGGYRIIPLCPFVKAQSQRHPDWADVMQG
jgi:predicted GNAT family acetyltransferase